MKRLREGARLLILNEIHTSSTHTSVPSGQFLAWALDHLIRVSTQMDKARLHFFEFSGGGEDFYL